MFGVTLNARTKPLYSKNQCIASPCAMLNNQNVQVHRSVLYKYLINALFVPLVQFIFSCTWNYFLELRFIMTAANEFSTMNNIVKFELNYYSSKSTESSVIFTTVVFQMTIFVLKFHHPLAIGMYFNEFCVYDLIIYDYLFFVSESMPRGDFQLINNY